MKVYSKGGVPVHTDYRENIIINADHPILAWKADKDRLRPDWFPSTVLEEFPGGLSKIGSQHSEDALSWNVLRTLQLNNRVQALTDIFTSRLDVCKIYFWGHDSDSQSQEVDSEIQDMLNEMEPWGMNGIRQQTESDIILRGQRHIVMVESKLGKPAKAIKAWQRSRLGMRREYVAFMEKLRLKLFADSFDYERDGNRFYQLFRNYLLGAALAVRWRAEFSLLVIVNAVNYNREGRSHQAEFNSFRSILADSSNAYLITWQQIWHALPKEKDLLLLRQFMAKHPLLALT